MQHTPPPASSWPHSRTHSPVLDKHLGNEHYRQMNVIHQQFNAMIATSKILLEELTRLSIPDLTYIQREEAKTILDILESFASPLFDHHNTDVWKRKEKKAFRISIEKIRINIYDARDNYTFARRLHIGGYNTIKIYKNITDLCNTIFHTINLITDPHLLEIEGNRMEMLTPLKQLVAMETVFAIYPCISTHSEKFLRNKFATSYTRIHQIQSNRP